MSEIHPYATRSRIRNAENAKIIPGLRTPKKNRGQKIPVSNGDSGGARTNNEKKEETDNKLGEIEGKEEVTGKILIEQERRIPCVEVTKVDESRIEDVTGKILVEQERRIPCVEVTKVDESRIEEVTGNILIEQERRIPCVEVTKVDESRIEEEIKENLMNEKEKMIQLKAEEEKMKLQLQLEEERRERLLLEQVRLEQIHTAEENRERLRIEQEKLEHLRMENQMMKEMLELQKLEVEERYQQEPPTPTLIDQDVGIKSNCFPSQKTLNNGLTNVKYEILSPEKSASATEKALKEFQEKRGNSNQKWKRTIKTPLSIRRKWRNDRLNKLLAPKSGPTFLNELKPGCTYNIHERKESHYPVFVATVVNNGNIIALGQGPSKMSAKKLAAENAIKVFVTDMFKNKLNEQLKNEEGCSSDLGLSEISWTGLASYALYRMLSDWQQQGNDFSFGNFKLKNKAKSRKAVSVKKNLPPDANKLHPAYVLNLMIPGLSPVEIERTQNNNVTSMTVGYRVNGKMYTGTAPSKKKAKFTAAKAVLTDLYGVKYDD